MPSRRDFIRSAGAGVGAAALGALPLGGELGGAPWVRRFATRPVVIASANGLRAVDKAMEVVEQGGDTLDAVVQGVNIVELDPDDYTVGYGSLPNEDGVVQLDAAVMHGPTRGAGAVGAIEGVKTPSRVAVAVMQYTDHVMLVGEGARRFARTMGFDADEDLLTEKARRMWLEWKAKLGADDDWLTPEQSAEAIKGYHPASSGPGSDAQSMREYPYGLRPWGTINCNAVSAKGEISGVTTTGGRSYKIPGRVGDSPIIGAGVYVDNDVGAAGSTGRGEANMKICGGFTVVEMMRRGMSPTDACVEACRRAVRWTVEKRLLDAQGRPNYQLNFYAVNKNGDVGGAAIWSGAKYAVNANGQSGLRDSAHIFERKG